MKEKVSQYHRMLFRWHCRNFYPFRKSMSRAERDYLSACFEMLDDYREVSETGFDRFSSFSYSHRVQGDRVNSSRLAFGSVEHPEKAFEAATPVLDERGIELPDSFAGGSELCRFGGIGWDFEDDQFKLYFRWLDLARLPQELASLVSDIDLSEHHPEGLVSFTYVKGQAAESKVYLYPKEGKELPEGVVGEAWMVTDKRGLVHQYDLYYPSNFTRNLNRVGMEIVDKYLKRGQTLDTINYEDENNFTLYFP